MLIRKIRANGTLSIGLDCSADDNGEVTPDLTKQEFRDDCDINKIAERVERGLPTANLAVRDAGGYLNLLDHKSYFEASVAVERARSAFMTLPAQLRQKLNHDPGKLADYIADERNRDELVKLGVLKKKVEQAPVPEASPIKDDSKK